MISETTNAARSEAGMLNQTPSAPNQSGRTARKGSRKISWRDSDRKIALLASPMLWKKLVITIWRPMMKKRSTVMRNIASKEDCIIVGRCADYILRDEPRLVTVFIAADLESRVRNLMRVGGKTEEEARRFIEWGDRKRAEYYNYYTFKQWGDSASYDLCINASRLDDDEEKVVELIKYFMKQRKLI